MPSLAYGIEFFEQSVFLFLGLLIIMLIQKQDWRFFAAREHRRTRQPVG